MSPGDDEKDAKKERRSPAKTGRETPAKAREGGRAKGKRAGVRKSVQEGAVSQTKEGVRGHRRKGKSQVVSGSRSGLDPREAVQHWLRFAAEAGYSRVAGHRQFGTDLAKIDTSEEEEKSLYEFCRLRGFSATERLEKLAQGPRPLQGVEHRVFYSLETDPPRVTKVTLPPKFGRVEHTPFLYLERLALFGEMFPELDIRFEDCVKDDQGQVVIVSSMRAFTGPHPTQDEIGAFLQELGFEYYSDGQSMTLDYRSTELGIIMRDCHPRNWVKAEDGHLIPVDISPEIG